jgi:hypothetical protein
MMADGTKNDQHCEAVMQVQRQEPIIIELDDPTPGWYRWAVLIGGVLVLALLIAPWLLDTSPAEPTTEVRTQQVQTAGSDSICQPTIDIPSFAQPAASMVIPSWMRLCDWFAEPLSHPPAAADRPSSPPYYPD